MKNKKWILALIASLIVALVLYGGYFIFIREEKSSTLTIMEKQWIENNKNKVIDFGILNHTPIFSSEGSGVIFDYLKDLEADTNLEFNKSSYEDESKNTSEYSFKVVASVAKDDILIYRDYYSLITREKVKYSNVSDIKDLTVGVLTSDLDAVGTALGSASNIKYQTFPTVSDLLKAMDQNSTTHIDAIVAPKVKYMDQVVKREALNFAYTLTEMKQDYVLHLGKTAKLNTILKKYTKKWLNEKFDASFAENFADTYYSSADIDEKEKTSMVGTRYTYGFIEQAPYDKLVSGKLYGMNAQLLKSFSNISGIEIAYKEYQSLGSLVEDFNSNKIDFFYETNSDTKYRMDAHHTVSIGSEQVVIATKSTDHSVLATLSDLKGRNVQVVDDTKIASYLKKMGVEYQTGANVTALLDQPKENNVVVMDFDAYQYYKNDQLSNYKINMIFSLDEHYSYAIRDVKANRVFADFFDFYLSYTQEQGSLYIGYDQLLSMKKKPVVMGIVSIIIGATLVLLGGIYGLNKYKKRKKPKKITVNKGDKIKYIDMLTSLKNRNYLNDNIAVWDESEVYPQTIIIIDLNNIAYINDNYGHEEGDKIIKEAANKLITTQIENTDIIRTNGNEFLIYMVGYDEKQVVSYTRKLNKELKDLTHGFGAAIGYSMIHDAIKTIDDAVNEATLEMKNVKEDNSN